jgi:hypothetical protein
MSWIGCNDIRLECFPSSVTEAAKSTSFVRGSCLEETTQDISVLSYVSNLLFIVILRRQTVLFPRELVIFIYELSNPLSV